MRRFFKWAAVPDGGKLIGSNPTIGVRLLQGKNREGFHTWTVEEIDRFQERWPIGTRERLAFDLLLYTGLARGDMVRLGKPRVRHLTRDIRANRTGRGPSPLPPGEVKQRYFSLTAPHRPPRSATPRTAASRAAAPARRR
jgi:integrase